ncbi:mannitol-1-phosphate 5-dehydrogenase [Oscillospiraceae bacterium PP1C4]
MNNKKAILIGAGKIGRGFIGQVLFDSGYDLVFVDTAKSLVDNINQYREYKVIVLGAQEQEYKIDNVRAYSPIDEKAVDEFVEADIVTTAVGPGIISKTADYIARGITKRAATKSEKPLTIIACENIEFGSTKLFESIKPLLNDQQMEYCKKYVAFPDAEVSRMVIPVEDTNPLTVKVEQYMEWLVDATHLTGDLTKIQGLTLTRNAVAYIKRKIYTLTGHAMLGYLGYENGYKYIYQAVYDDSIFETVYKALIESGKGWSMEYGESEEKFNEYITIMLRRFADVRLKDPCVRICKEPIRKLSQDERFIEPALTALKHGIMPSGIITGIKSVLKFDYAEDEQAVELRKMIKENGLSYILKKICGLSEDDLLYKLIA